MCTEETGEKTKGLTKGLRGGGRIKLRGAERESGRGNMDGNEE